MVDFKIAARAAQMVEPKKGCYELTPFSTNFCKVGVAGRLTVVTGIVTVVPVCRKRFYQQIPMEVCSMA